MRKFFFAFLAAALGGPVPLSWAGLSVQTDALRGEGGYAERSLAVTARFPWKGPDDFEEPVLWFRGARTSRDRDGVSEATYTNEAGAGVEFLEQFFAEVNIWRSPETSEAIGAYRAWGGQLAAGVRGAGWWPHVSVEAPPQPGAVESRWDLWWEKVTHEEKLQIAPRPAAWYEVGEQIVGVGVTETFRQATWVRLSLESHAYDRNVSLLSRRLEFFSVLNTDGSAPLELLHGFISHGWSLGVGRRLGRWADVSARWSRSFYETSPSDHSDTYRARATAHLGKFFSLTGTYEVFQPQGFKSSDYVGVGLGFDF